MQPKVAELTIKIGGSNRPQSATIKAQKTSEVTIWTSQPQTGYTN